MDRQLVAWSTISYPYYRPEDNNAVWFWYTMFCFTSYVCPVIYRKIIAIGRDRKRKAPLGCQDPICSFCNIKGVNTVCKDYDMVVFHLSVILYAFHILTLISDIPRFKSFSVVSLNPASIAIIHTILPFGIVLF